jgi:murein L,D-transpeptidase YcbB/YkuD
MAMPTRSLLVVLFATLPAAGLQAQSEAEVARLIRTRIEAVREGGGTLAGREMLHAAVALPAFYQRREFRPAWSDAAGPRDAVDQLLAAIRLADREGLEPLDYHLEGLRQALGDIRRSQAGRRPSDPSRLADLDLLATDAFLLYASHLLSGRVNPETFDPEWLANRRGAEMDTVLDAALTAGAVAATLRGLLPAQPGYGRLRDALVRYRAVAAAGGWPVVPTGDTLRRGSEGGAVAALRRRLELSGDLAAAEDAAVFDETVEEGVRRFQVRHGLEPDGVVGDGVLAVLNVPVEERIRQLELNMERWRWLPQELGERHILVNIAGFDLDMVEEGRVVLSMRAVVGRSYRRTPVFSAPMTYLVLSPYWNVPRNLAVQDILPLARRDTGYFARQGMRVFDGWGADAAEIDPASVDWSQVRVDSFPYRFRQDPGPTNALGRAKFMFPNRFNVYLHDTPARTLFDQARRDFSSGCIRIEKPVELAEYLLADRSEWTRQQILAAMERGAEQTVRLTRPVPVHLLYWTAWAEADGTIQFRDDLYGRDARLAAALDRRPPAGSVAPGR